MNSRIVWASLAGLLGLVPRSQAGNTPPVSGRSASAPPSRADVIRQRNLPNVTLVTHEGRQVCFYDDLVKGRMVVIHFMYTRCRGICLPSTANLAEVQKALGARMGRDVTFLSLSLDAEEDSPSDLKAFGEAHGAGPGWVFLTGQKADIELLRRRLGAYDPDPSVDADRSQHTAVVILGNEPKGRWQAIPALAHPVRIRQAIERTLLPPSQWRVGAEVVAEVPFEKSAASQSRVEPVDFSRIPPQVH